MVQGRIAIIATCAIIILLLVFTGVAVHLSMVNKDKAKNVPTKDNSSGNDRGESPPAEGNKDQQPTPIVVEPKPPCKCPHMPVQDHHSHVNSLDPVSLLLEDELGDTVSASTPPIGTELNVLQTRKRQEIP